MTHHNQLEDKLGGADNFRQWKYIISLILEENDLDQFITGEVPKLEGYEAKDAHKRIMNKGKIIIAYYIKDHLIPHVSSLNTPNEVLYSLTKLFKGNNITQKMKLWNQVKDAKIQNSKTMQSYFTTVSQIKEQLEAFKECRRRRYCYHHLEWSHKIM